MLCEVGPELVSSWIGSRGRWREGKCFHASEWRSPSPPPPTTFQAGVLLTEKGIALSLPIFWRRHNWTWHLIKRICNSQTAPGIITPACATASTHCCGPENQAQCQVGPLSGYAGYEFTQLLWGTIRQ